MKRLPFDLLLAVAALSLAACSKAPRESEVSLTGQVVDYGRGPSGMALRGVLYRPPGPGPFPVLLYAHGSAPGSWSNEAFEAVAPAFTSRGWAVFAPYRRGQGLSRDAGPFIRDEIDVARRAGGAALAQERLAQLLATDHMDDQTQAFRWLLRQPFVAQRRIAVMGNSFGGIIALLSSERLPACAAIDASGAAEAWAEAPAVRALMRGAATRARAPIFFFQAANDHDLSPSRELAAVMRQAGRAAFVRIYPPFGSPAREGHAFAYKSVPTWSEDAHRFLTRFCR